LGSWTLITPIIATKFLPDHCLFLLEAICVNNFGLFPFQAHLKLVRELLSLHMVACVSLFVYFAKKGIYWL
jgi:hypothetical protein